MTLSVDVAQSVLEAQRLQTRRYFFGQSGRVRYGLRRDQSSKATGKNQTSQRAACNKFRVHVISPFWGCRQNRYWLGLC